MTRKRLILILASSAALGVLALAVDWVRDLPKVSTGFFANILCSETFVSGLDPDKTFSETTAAMPGSGLLTWATRHRVDRARKDVTVTLFGVFASRAIDRDGVGCTLDHGNPIAEAVVPTGDPPAAPPLPEIAGPAVVAPATPQLAAALAHAFAEPAMPPFRHTRAIVVVRDGRIVAERYADGFGIDTPLLGFSATKSVVSALIGILARQGRLTPDAPAPVAVWQGQHDPRHAVTVDQLLRQTAGLALGSSLQANIGAALEPVNHMKFVEDDMAAYAERAMLETAPGSAWNYHDGNYLILSQLIRDAAGGRPADTLRFARDALFAPLGMRHAILQFDGAGTPEGSSQMLASARDWARFGQLYLDDGVAGGTRILPEGWVGYSASPTSGAYVGYGAGFWTNLGDSKGANYRIAQGWPRDAFFARGSLGQYVIIIPSERLVIVRFGRTANWPLDADGVSRLVGEVVAASTGQPKLAGK
jgi:CubicO group peptidase (beta-lactamase class C family)